MNLPKGFKGLDQAYKGAMQRIDDQLEGFRFLAKQVLGWLTYAKRLMSMKELQHVIAIELGERKFDEENLADPSELVSVCAGLVVVDAPSNFVKLVHYTTQQYFVQHGESLLPGARKTIAESCLTYLMYDDFAAGWLHKKDNERDGISTVADDDDTAEISSYFHPRVPKVQARLNNHLFYEYAVKFWAMHANHVVGYGAESLFLDFARDGKRISSTTQALMVLNWDGSMLAQFDWDESRSSKPVSAMHLLAYLGADRLISILLDQGFEADTKDLNNATPLWWAAYKGEETVAKLLLSRKDVDVNNVNYTCNQTPLFEAAAMGHVEMVKLLISREDVDVNTCNSRGRTPLLVAAEIGYIAVVELLLTRKDVEADAKNLEGDTTLLFAAKSGHDDILRQLLERDKIDINTVNKRGDTALLLAVVWGHVGVARILLARADINIDHVDKQGRTPLMRAARFGHSAIVELLLSHGGVNVDIEDTRGWTALLEAAVREFEDVVKLFLAHATINLDTEDDKWRRILTQVEDGQKNFIGYGKEGQQATLKLLRAALKERSPRK